MGTEPTTWVCALTENQSHSLLGLWEHSNQLSHTSKGQNFVNFIHEMKSCLKFSYVEIELITFFPQYATSHELAILIETTTCITGGKHKAHGLNPALHFVLSGPAPSLYLAVAERSGLTIKEQLHLYVLKLHSAL